MFCLALLLRRPRYSEESSKDVSVLREKQNSKKVKCLYDVLQETKAKNAISDGSVLTACPEITSHRASPEEAIRRAPKQSKRNNSRNSAINVRTLAGPKQASPHQSLPRPSPLSPIRRASGFLSRSGFEARMWGPSRTTRCTKTEIPSTLPWRSSLRTAIMPALTRT